MAIIIRLHKWSTCRC